MSFTELERIVDRALRSLPPPPVPDTLLPRVLAAVQKATLRPWYTRAWFTWPRGWQVASLAVLVLAVAGIVTLISSAPRIADRVAPSLVASVVSDVGALASGAGDTTTAIRVVWEALLAPVIPYALFIVLAMCLACGVFATAFNYLVFGKAVP